MIVVDSSNFISWMRASRNPITLLAVPAQAGELVSCGIIRSEVLRGVVKPNVKEQLTEFFQIVPEVALTPALLHEAAEMAWRLDRQGNILPITDLLIGACAQKAKATLISEDPHFQRIPGLKVRAEL
ncbi:MAG: tRNA(fMet)-specific endonuclease VapC [Verrucomicrobiae bacterium]|nr:tRNA(fMet)-specific endonuclease VapC [Verrucomicrobiae bacterium]